MLFIQGLIVAKLLAVAFAAGSITQEIATTKPITGAHVRILAYHVSFQVEKSCQSYINVILKFEYFTGTADFQHNPQSG